MRGRRVALPSVEYTGLAPASWLGVIVGQRRSWLPWYALTGGTGRSVYGVEWIE